VLELRRNLGALSTGLRPGWAAASLAAAALTTGCGGGSAPPAVSAGSAEARVWVDNAVRLVEQLRHDVDLSAAGGSTLASARRAVADDNTVYVLLVAYGDFGDCDRELAAAGTPSPDERNVAARVLSACAPLRRASTLFDRAMRLNDPRTLRAATRASADAAPLLVRALAALEALR
jgi:hypothetical protein